MNRKKRGSERKGGSSGKVREVVETHSGRQLPVIRRTTHIDKLAEAIKWFRHARQLYVVDDDGRLLGVITLASLVRHIFVHHHGADINPRHLLSSLTTETAEDIMLQSPLVVTLEEGVEDVLERMVAADVEEIPVVDDEGRVVADLTMIDLLMAV